MSTLNRIQASIDLSIIKHNFLQIKQFTNGADIIAVIKANAYGHGAIRLARFYKELGAKILAVACIDEALELRNAGICAPIMIFGATPPNFAELLSDNEIIQSVSSVDYAKALSESLKSTGKTIKIHIKLDTGMTRFGLYAHKGFAESAAAEAEEITKYKGLIPDGIFTHFAEAESTDKAFTDEQFSCFSDVVELLKKKNITFNFCHCANSAAVVNYKRAHLNCVRPGLILYGYSPSDSLSAKLNLRPAMKVESLVGDVRKIRKGDTVSYNRNFRAERDMKIAVVSCGYADGLPRALSGKGYFTINGKKAPILGNICMDLTLVDVSDIPDVSPFDKVIIFGGDNGKSLNELSKLAGTIPYELLTSLSNRVVRTYSPVDA